MELYIRSQDKKQLLKVNDGLFIANGFNDTTDTFIGLKNVGHIGRYTTEERALEVLDEIQKIIINNEIIKLTIPNVNDIKGKEELYKKEVFEKMIYEMPKE